MYYYNHWEIKNTCNVFWICPSSTLLFKPLPDTWPWLLPVSCSSWPMGYPSKHRQPWGKLTLLRQEPSTTHSFSVRIRAWGIPAPSTLGNFLACSCVSNYSCYECAFTNLESMDADENHPLLDLAIQPCYLSHANLKLVTDNPSASVSTVLWLQTWTLSCIWKSE